ncbi:MULTISPECIES: ribbon-helix-helix protein, CopG family [unclassified Gilliamella]|uniref:ribbon-helix-helix protein, CopG family n=1 Tax=unclassified Gilliamella TaxID=2685620 RepID=UPI00226AD45F|nr:MULTISPECIES: ribbon-helix-helix protein, CopG family [unclassified Gilliamella]MCX8583492.1 ribbon-helix-helix protein, CopG family [Gilliamella sp. B3372]MCX8594032.1 ribbon-helix-helix protein, CopG family [Gilliamella sp. B3367]
MALPRAVIQKKSDEKRGVKSKGYKLPVEIIDLIIELSAKTEKSQSKIIEEAILMYKKTL